MSQTHETPVLRSSLKWKLAQAAHFANRFRALPRANRLFNDLTEQAFAERTVFGHRFICDLSRVGPQKLIYLVGERYVEEARLVKVLLRPGMTVADVGANIGYYVLLFAQGVGSGGKIIAIEPSPENLGELRINITHNRLDNARIVAKAVGADKRSVGLRSGINSGVVTNNNGRYTVEQDTLDNIISERIDLLKMDIEGYEGAALAGATRILSRDRPIVFLEIHPKQLPENGSAVDAVMNIIARHYANIEAYEPMQPRSFFGKLLKHYTGRGPVRIANIDGYMRQCLSGNILSPFWIVCRP
jgi:FkbM family methyltransferase